jgi:hypothetical protein
LLQNVLYSLKDIALYSVDTFSLQTIKGWNKRRKRRSTVYHSTSCRSQVILFALASQSSHNTWTKKHSMVLYWGNVLVGSLTCCAIHLSHGGMSSDVQGAAMTFLLGLVVTSAGIVLLVAGSMYQRHFFLTMKQEKAKSTSSK